MPDARIHRGTAACEADTVATEIYHPVSMFIFVIGLTYICPKEIKKNHAQTDNVHLSDKPCLTFYFLSTCLKEVHFHIHIDNT